MTVSPFEAVRLLHDGGYTLRYDDSALWPVFVATDLTGATVALTANARTLLRDTFRAVFGVQLDFREPEHVSQLIVLNAARRGTFSDALPC